jgi:LPXTG-motif cell wall-anchored protein
MKKLVLLVAVICLSIFAVQTVSAQDEGTFIEVTESKDSSHIKGVLDFSDDFGEEEEKSGNIGMWIGIAVGAVAGGAYYVMKKKKK